MINTVAKLVKKITIEKFFANSAYFMFQSERLVKTRWR